MAGKTGGVDGRADRWTEYLNLGWHWSMNGRMNVWVYGWHGWVYRWEDGLMGGRKIKYEGRWVNGRVNGMLGRWLGGYGK